MKIRNTPFGYLFKDGKCTINPSEEDVFRRIVSLYINGASLKTISDTLNEEKVEYRPGVEGWNSSRVKRILEDSRHMGTEQYPAIIGADTYAEIINLLHTRSKQNGTNRKSAIYNLGAPVICAVCGCAMQRKQDTRYKIPQRWICTNNACGIRVPITDESLIRDIIHMINTLIESPDRIRVDYEMCIFPCEEVIQLESEINRLLENPAADKELLIDKIMRCASLKYDGISPTIHTSAQIKQEYEIAEPTNTYPSVLVKHTVSGILVDREGCDGLLMINGQRIGKEP